MNTSPDRSEKKGMASFFGKFKTIKDLFLEKLDSLLERTAAIEKATNATLESTTANLDAGTYLVESLSRQALSQEMFFKKVGSLQQRQLDILEDNKDDLQVELKYLAAGQDRLLQAVVALPPSDIAAVVRRSSSPSPELALMSYLYSFLPNRAALDATARTGEATTSMLEAGFTVYAFEPHPALFEQLTQHLQGNPHCHLFNFALAPAGCEHESTQTLSSLHAARTVPADIGLVRLGSSSVQVIEGAGEYAYPVIVSDWAIAEEGRLAGQVERLRRRGYYWHIVLDTTGTQTSFYCNHVRAAEAARGHLFFFQSYALFSEAHAWCRAVLPATYFC